MSRSGFSLVKLLVILAVIAILIGLLLPATTRVRAAAARANSMNNIRQICIAIHNYESSYAKFPTACDYGAGAPTGFGVVSLHYQVLPFVEQAALFQLYQQGQPQSYYDKDTGAARNIIRMYLAPNDPSAPDGMNSIGVSVKAPGAKAPFAASFTGTYATTSYVANGLLFVPGASFKTMIDGSSNTLMIAERYQVCKQGEGDKPPTATSPDVYCLWGLGAYSASTAAFALDTPKGDNVPTAEPANRMFVPSATQTGTKAKGHWANDAGKDFEYPRVFSDHGGASGFQVTPRGPTICDARIPQSFNPGGMVVAMGDGSCRAVAPSVSAYTFWSAVTPAGNEVLGDW